MTDTPIARIPLTDGRYLHVDLTHSNKQYLLASVPFTYDEDGNFSCDIFRDMTCCMATVVPASHWSQKTQDQIARTLFEHMGRGDFLPAFSARMAKYNPAGTAIALRNPTNGSWEVWDEGKKSTPETYLAAKDAQQVARSAWIGHKLPPPELKMG